MAFLIGDRMENTALAVKCTKLGTKFSFKLTLFVVAYGGLGHKKP